jgi:hypothetical protein
MSITLEIPEPTWQRLPLALRNRLAVHILKGQWQRDRSSGECVFVLECRPSIEGALPELEKELIR